MTPELPNGAEIVGVFGPVASGKTFLVRQWMENLDRVVAFDSVGEMSEATDQTIVDNPRLLWDTLRVSPWYFRVTYVPGSDLDYNFSCVRNILWWIPSDKWLIVDEFHFICPVNAIEQPMNDTLRLARKVKLGLVGVSQRIADVHKLFTSSCRMVVLFWTQEARDLDAISQRWGNDVAERVRNLRPLIYNDVTQEVQQTPQCLVIRKGEIGEPKTYDL